jgi:hypothetical protein
MKSERDDDSALTTSCPHLTKKSVLIVEEVCKKHGGGELDVVDRVIDALEGPLHNSGVLEHDILMVNAELVEFSKHYLSGVKAFLVLKLLLVLLFFVHLEPLMQSNTSVVVNVSFVGDVFSHNDLNDSLEVLKRQGPTQSMRLNDARIEDVLPFGDSILNQNTDVCLKLMVFLIGVE